MIEGCSYISIDDNWFINRHCKLCNKREVILMRCRVQLDAGQVFNEEVRAVDYQEARQVALARNPNATVVSVTAVF